MLKIHDYVSRATLAQVGYLADLLRAALPNSFGAQVDWKKVVVLSEQFPQRSGMLQRMLCADIVAQLPRPRRSVDSICALIEAKSGYEKRVIKQMDSYSYRILEKHHQCTHVMRVVFYTGERPWPAQKRLEELAEVEHLLYPHSYTVADINSDELLQRLQTVGMRALVMASRRLRHIRDAREYWSFIRGEIVPVLAESQEQYELMIWYSLQVVRNKTAVDYDMVKRYIKDKRGAKKYMTMADHLVKQGERVGIAEGKRAGIAEGKRVGERMGIDKGRIVGRTEGRTEVAQRMLRKNFDSDVVREVTGLSAAEIEALRHTSNGSQQ